MIKNLMIRLLLGKKKHYSSCAMIGGKPYIIDIEEFVSADEQLKHFEALNRPTTIINNVINQ